MLKTDTLIPSPQGAIHEGVQNGAQEHKTNRTHLYP